VKLIDVLSLSSVVFLWGSTFTIIKLGVLEVPPITLAFIRFLIALPFLFALTFLQNRNAFGKHVLENWRAFALLGLTGVTLQNLLQNVGIQYTTASNASLIIAINPVFISLLSHFYLKEKASSKLILGAALAFFGVLFVIEPQEWSLYPTKVFGDLLCLGSAISWTLYSVLGRKTLSKCGANEMTTYSMAFGALFLLPAAIFLEKPAVQTSIPVVSMILYLGLLCSALAFLLWNRALKDVPATKAGAFLFFIPVVSVVIAHFVLFEPLDIFFIIGTLLVMAGVAVTEL
jgi:drug/metabolite transporter (DMT)-like permease